MNKKKVFGWIVVVLIACMLVFGVPLIINWCYSQPPVIYTHWSAADVLSFYGTLLGTIVAVITIVLTIRFSQWQLGHEYRVQRRTAQLERVEHAVDRCIVALDPKKLELIPVNAIADGGAEMLIAQIHSYQINVQAAIEALHSHMSHRKNRELAGIVVQIDELSNQLLQVANKYWKLMSETIRSGCENECAVDFNTYAMRKQQIQQDWMAINDCSYLHLITEKERIFAEKYDRIPEEDRDTFWDFLWSEGDKR